MKFSFGVKRLAMTSGVLVCAMGTGYLMQNVLVGGKGQSKSGIAVATVTSSAYPVVAATKRDIGEPTEFLPQSTEPVLERANQVSDGGSSATKDMHVEDVILTSALPSAPVAASETITLPSGPVKGIASTDVPLFDLPAEEKAPTFACEIELNAEPGGAAMAVLALEAGCMTNERFTLHHSGMMISGVTDKNGLWQASVPALAENALFIAAFSNGEGAVANTTISDLNGYDRYVVQWKGETDIQIHAFENGASYADAGHVWRGSGDDAVSTQIGFLTRFDDKDLAEGLRAEIYTFPSGQIGKVEINIELQVGDATCNEDVEAQAFIMSGAEHLEARDLMIAMPDCGAVGEFLVLKNPYEDLTIARN